MPQNYFLGTAVPVAQVDTFTISGLLAGETFTLSIGGILVASAVDTVGGNTDAAHNAIIAQLAQSFDESSEVAPVQPYAGVIDAVDTTGATAGTMTLTSRSAGMPFVVNIGGTGVAFIAQVATTDSSGPHHWDTDANWSLGVKPTATHDVTLRDSSVSLLWGLVNPADAPASLSIDASYTGRLGLRYDVFTTSADGTQDTSEDTADNPNAHEYRPTYLGVGYFGQIDIGKQTYGNEQGSGRLKINLNSTAGTDVIVHSTSISPVDVGRPAVRLLGVHVDHTVLIHGAVGGAGIAVDVPGEVSTFDKVEISDSATSATTVSTGDGLTLDEWNQDGGVGVLRATGTGVVVRMVGGTLTTEGDFQLDGPQVSGGLMIANNVYTGAADSIAGTASVFGGILDMTQSAAARQVADIQIHPGGIFKRPYNVVTTNPMAFIGNSTRESNTISMTAP